jgi:hypothetical protein
MLPEPAHDGAYVYFSSPRGVSGPLPDSANTMLIQRVAADGRIEVVYERKGAYAVQPSLSPDGRHMVFARITSYAGIWHLMLTRTGDKPGTAIRLTERNLSAYAPRWSPGGDLIAFTGYRDGDPGWGVYLLVPDGTGEVVRVSTGLAQTRSPSWSPDGNWLVFEGRTGGRYDLFRLPLKAVTGLPARRTGSRTLDALFAAQPFFTTDANDAAGLANLFDGDTASRWYFRGTPRWIETEFPEPVTVAGLNLHHGMPSYFKYPSGSCSAKAYRFQAMIDGEWGDLIDPVTDSPRYTGGSQVSLTRKHRFDPVTATRFRLVVTDTNDTRLRVRSPTKPCVPVDQRVTHLREIELLDRQGEPVIR